MTEVKPKRVTQKSPSGIRWDDETERRFSAYCGRLLASGTARKDVPSMTAFANAAVLHYIDHLQSNPAKEGETPTINPQSTVPPLQGYNDANFPAHQKLERILNEAPAHVAEWLKGNLDVFCAQVEHAPAPDISEPEAVYVRQFLESLERSIAQAKRVVAARAKAQRTGHKRSARRAGGD